MNKQTKRTETYPKLGRLSIFRPLWWILQSIVIEVWKILLTLVLVWQLLHILFTGKKHEWSSEFTRKFIRHFRLWLAYTFWVKDTQPKIIEY